MGGRREVKSSEETFHDTPLSLARRGRFGTRVPKQRSFDRAKLDQNSAPAGRLNDANKVRVCMGKPPR